MKGLIFCLALFASTVVKAQIIDTAALRSYINLRIVTNGNRSITAQNLNDIFNAYLNLWPNDSIGISKGTQYDTLYYFKNGKSTFYTLIGGTNVWTTTGNGGLNPVDNFIGTVDSVPLKFKVNNQTVINIDQNRNVMFNTATPIAKNSFLGTGAFTDTLTATTMGITDSSNRVATTAWVKRRLSPIVYSGTYIPVVTVESGNVTIDQVLECAVMRIGNIVNVAGKIVVTVNDGNQAAFALSLPFPSTFLSEDDCSGTIGCLSTPGYNGGAIEGEEGTNSAVVIFQPGAVSTTAVIFQFTYSIK